MRFTVIMLTLTLAGAVHADRPSEPAPPGEFPRDKQGKFTFVRVVYDSVGGYGESHYVYDGRHWERWETDYPEAEENFLIRLRELSTVAVNPTPIHLRLTDPRIYDYPFIYMCDVGWQNLRKEEAEHLRRYLQRGGFLWIDDFWGDAELMNMEHQMAKVFPDLEWRRIPRDHPILNIVFPLKECPQVPAKTFWDSWHEPFDHPQGHREPTGGIEGVKHVNFRGLFDTDSDRLLAVATHNSDIGDGWEREAEAREFFETFSTKAYAIGINIVVYALTH